MASKLQPITNTIETLVVANTTLLDLRQGTDLIDQGSRPYAMITYGQGTISSQGIDGTIDSHLQTVITVRGDDWDETQQALEELMVVFMDETVFNSLCNAHDAIIDFKSIGYIPAQLAEGDVVTLSKFAGQMIYDLHLRYNY